MKVSFKTIYIYLFAVCSLSLSSCDELFGPSRDNYAGPAYSDSSTSNTGTNQGDTVKTDSMAEAALTKANEVESKLASQSDSINGLYDQVKNLEKRNSKMIDKTSAYTFMIVEFVILSLIIFLLYRQILRLGREISMSQRSTHSDNHVHSIVRKEIDSLARQINNKNADQDRRISDLLTKITRLEARQGSFVPPYHPAQSITPEIEKKIDEPAHSRGNVFYMPRTMTPMQFEDSKKKFTKDDTVCFTFKIKGKEKASFIFEPYDESSIRRAFDSREETLLTVCDLEIKNPSGKSFENVEPGEAELNGSIWQVTKKLKLRYV